MNLEKYEQTVRNCLANGLSPALNDENDDLLLLWNSLDTAQLTETERKELLKELGSMIWYSAAIAHKLGTSLESVMVATIGDLTKQHVDGLNS